MGRHSEENGSWFRLWSKQWLKDEKLIKAGDMIEVAFVRILCAAQECRDDGGLSFRGLSNLLPEQIQEAARITSDQFNGLVKFGLVVKDGHTYRIKNWEKWQPNKKKT